MVRLNVLRGSPARRLYERHGFTLETEDTVDVFMVRPPAHRAQPGETGLTAVVSGDGGFRGGQ